MAPPAPRRPPSPRDSDWQLQRTADGPAMTPRAACPDSSPVRVRGLVVNAKLYNQHYNLGFAFHAALYIRCM